MSVNSVHANLEALEGWKKQLKKGSKSTESDKNKTRGKKK
jgi:hypothetical protein